MTRSLLILALLVSGAAPAQPPQIQPNAQTPPRPAPSGIRYDTKSGYALAFVDADVKRVVDAVLGTMMGVDYSLDPAVQGNITLRTSQPVARESLVPLLENALASVNAVIVTQGSTLRVVSRQSAKSRAPLAASGAPAQGFATEIVTLKYGSAKEIGRLLEQFLGDEVVAGTDEAYNQLVITGSAEERSAAKALIDRFDVDTLAKMNFETYRLESVDAGTLVTELNRIFKPPFDILGSRVRLVPLPRLKSVLVIALDRADLARIEPWIRRLDTGVSGKRRLYNYRVQNGRAKDMASSLQLVLGGASGSAGMSSGTASIPSGGFTADATGPIGGATSAAGGLTPAEAIAPQTPLPGNDAPLVAGGAGLRIVPNDATNSLLIYADGEEYEFVRDALDKLDQPISQVLIEATLAEVTLNNDFRFGVDFTVLGDQGRVINSTNRAGTPSPIFPGYSVSLVSGNVQGILNTLQSKTNVRVLSAPKLIVLNNETATLQVGDQVPIVTQQSQSVSAPGAPIVNNVELRDTGVILKVTPRVNDSGNVTLDIAQEVSDVAQTTTSGINSPTIQQRRLASTVVTRTGQMIALGGLIRDARTRIKSGIPVLSQIPAIGGLFGTYSNNAARTELIILITPTVIRSPIDVKKTVDDLLSGLDATGPMVDAALQRQVGGRGQ